MFQFRFVILALLIPLAGLTALVVGTGAVYGVVMPPYEATTTATTSAAAGAVATFASRSVDAAAAAASDADVAAAVAKGESPSPKAEAALLAKAGPWGAPSFALIIGVDGTVRSKSGLDPNLEPALGGFPVVAEALTGLARDGVIVKDGAPIHVAASPSYDETGNLVGVVMLGWPFTDELVASFGRAASGIVVVSAPKGIIGALPEGVTAAQVAARTPFGEITRNYGPFPVLMPDLTRYFVGSLPLYVNEPGLSLVSITDRDAAYDGIAAIQAGIVGATVVLLVLVLGIIMSTLRAMNRPLELITEHLSEVQQHGANVGILPEAGLGPMLRLGKQINMLLQSMPATRPGATAPLFGGSSTSSQDFPSPAFGGDIGMSGAMPASPPLTPMMSSPPAPMSEPASMPSMPSPPTSNPSQPTPMAPALSTPPTSPAISEPPPTSPAGGGIAGLFDDGPDPLAAFRVPSSAPAAAAPPPPAPAPAPSPPPEPHAMQPEATVMFQVPESLLAASATAPPKAPTPAPSPPSPPPVSRTSVDDNRTVVAQVPQELLAQVSPKNDVNSADEAHYKEVYEKFVQTRMECGEDTSDLSYDRFVAKLLKNRQQIIEKHKAKSVRFQVYVKDGKAALRALPVRD